MKLNLANSGLSENQKAGITTIRENLARKDLRFFIESCLYILDQFSKKVPFKFNFIQNDYWSKITPRDYVTKARREGISSLRLGRMYAKCCFMMNRRCVIISHEKEATVRLLNIIKFFHEHNIIKSTIHIGRDSDWGLTFPDTQSSIWVGTAGSRAFGRGDAITDLHLSEFAWYSKPEMVTGALEALTRDSEACLETTQHGFGTFAHKAWLKAKEHRPSVILKDGTPIPFTPIFYGWWQFPDYATKPPGPLVKMDSYEQWLKTELGLSDDQIYWRRLKIPSMLDPDKFVEEYPATEDEAFIQEGIMVFDPQALRRIESQIRPIKWQGDLIDKGGRVGLEPW